MSITGYTVSGTVFHVLARENVPHDGLAHLKTLGDGRLRHQFHRVETNHFFHFFGSQNVFPANLCAAHSRKLHRTIPVTTAAPIHSSVEVSIPCGTRDDASVVKSVTSVVSGAAETTGAAGAGAATPM